MCGIISVKNLTDSTPVNQTVKLLYFNQQARGHEGYGFIGLNKRRLCTYRSTTESDFLSLLNTNQYDEVILHHRLPTSTKNTLKSTHPFMLTRNGKRYYFVHNGIISNDKELSAKHDRLGIKYKSFDRANRNFNDSEALAWEFVLWLTNKQKRIEAQGSAAFVCLVTNAKTGHARRLYFYRNAGSPLMVFKDKTLLVITSEGNWGSEVPTNQLYYYDYATRQVVKDKELRIEESSSFASWLTSNDDFERDIAEIGSDIDELDQRREYLLSMGDFETAAELTDELEYLWQEYGEVKQAIRTGESTTGNPEAAF